MKKRYLNILLALSLYLGLHNGYIALWNTERSEPVQVFPYKAALYPKIDQNALRSGIRIDSTDQLYTLLADFLS